MTYLEKLSELNTRTLTKAKQWLSAKSWLEGLPFEKIHKATRIQALINFRFADYQAALDDSNNLLSFMRMNQISLQCNFSVR